MRLDRPPRPRPAIGLTSLIDVVFILLFFFMLVANLQPTHTVRLNLPRPSAETRPDPAGPPSVLVRIRADGRVDLNGGPLALEDLTAVLGARLRERPEIAVLVQPADGVTLESILAVFDRLAAAGVPALRLQ